MTDELIIHPGSPVVDDDGVQAFINQPLKIKGREFNWTWFNPSTPEQLAEGPSFEDGTPRNRAVITLVYQAGPFQVFWLDQYGDPRGMWSANWWRLPDEPVSTSWRGKLAALDALKEHMQGDGMVSQWAEYHRGMFTAYANDEEARS